MLMIHDRNTETPRPRYEPDWKNLMSGRITTGALEATPLTEGRGGSADNNAFW